MDTLIKMAEYFECSVDELLGLNTLSIDVKDTKIKLGLKELELKEFDDISLKDLGKLLGYIENELGIELAKLKK